MKYIDANKLIAEIEKHIKEVKDAEERFTPNMGFFDAKLSGIYDVLAIIDSLQQEQPEEICSKCVYHKKDDGYCYYPHGGMRRRINENGVYECTAFWEREQEKPNKDNCPFDKGDCRYCTVQFCGAREENHIETYSTAGIVDYSSEEHPNNFTSFEWLIGRLMFRGCDLWGMTDGEDDNGVVTKLIKDRAAEMMELLERELDPNAEPVDFEKLALEKYPIQMVAKDPFDDEDDTKEDFNEYEREAYLEGLKKGYELWKGGSK